MTETYLMRTAGSSLLYIEETRGQKRYLWKGHYIYYGAYADDADDAAAADDDDDDDDEDEEEEEDGYYSDHCYFGIGDWDKIER